MCQIICELGIYNKVESNKLEFVLIERSYHLRSMFSETGDMQGKTQDFVEARKCLFGLRDYLAFMYECTSAPIIV